jgi:uncharacterized protein (DUF1684 family)
VTRRTAVPIAWVLACSVLAAQSPAPAASAVDAILAAHKKADDEYARAVMSPFTAVAVQYFEPGQTVRLGVDADRVAFDPAAAMAAAIDVTLQDGSFWMTPVPGSAPVVVRQKTAGGTVADAPGIPVAGKTKLAERDVANIGRHLVEFLAGAATGNVRVFDPDAAPKKHYAGLKWFAPDLAFQVKAAFEPFASPEKVVIMTSRGLQKDYYRVGRFTFTLSGAAQALTVLSTSPAPKAGDELFLPFRDATTGKESYSVGRYLFPKFAGAGASYLIDFNLATNPLCNYSPHYNCPIPPKENVVSAAIRAGEMAYPH